MAEKHVEPSIDSSLPVGDNSDSADALDKAFAAVDNEEVAPPDNQEPSDTPDIPEELPAEQTKEQTPVEPAEQPQESDVTKTESTPRTPETTTEDDPILKALDAVKLRSDASQKTKDTFANLKQISAEGLKSARAEIARIKAEQQQAIEEARKAAIEEARKQVALPEETQKELEELRQLRSRVDVESDPQFKKQFDVKLESNYEAVYKELALYGLKESELKVLRKIGETEKIENITEMAAKLPPASRLKIEAKLLENMSLSDARENALKDARERAQQIWQDREGQTKAQQEAEKAAWDQAVASFKGHDIFKKSDIPVNTPPEQKKKLEAENQHREKLQKLYDEVVNDNTPIAKAEAAFGLVLAHQFKSELDTTKAELAAAKKELEGIKKRSGVADKGRLVNVSPEGRPSKSAQNDLDAGESLDDLAKQFGIR